MRSYTKRKLAKETLSLLKKDKDKYLSNRHHYTVLGITYPTYAMIFKTGLCRSDVEAKIVNHLNTTK